VCDRYDRLMKKGPIARGGKCYRRTLRYNWPWWIMEEGKIGGGYHEKIILSVKELGTPSPRKGRQFCEGGRCNSIRRKNGTDIDDHVQMKKGEGAVWGDTEGGVFR